MIENVYLSLIVFASGLAPSGVYVVEGESYGVQFTDPRGKIPSITVTLEDINDAEIELGSIATDYTLTLTAVANSRRQRDALKSIIYSGLVNNLIPIYSSFTASGILASGAVATNYGQVTSKIIIRDTPDFQSNRDKFFWTAIAFCTFTVLGT